MEEVLRRTASQRNMANRRKSRRIRIYNLKAYRKILIQLIISGLILISIASVRGIDNPYARNAVKEIDKCISTNVDWMSMYKGVSIWFSNIITGSGSIFKQPEKSQTVQQIKGSETTAGKEINPSGKVVNEKDKPTASNIPMEIKPVFSSTNSIDTDAKYIKSKYKLYTPVNGSVSSPFGIRINPITHKEELHSGVDIRVNVGTIIYSALPGQVIEARKGTTYGNFIKIQSGEDIVTVYAHCSKLLVKTGEKISKGQKIAKSGNTGMSSGPHLHFEIQRENRPVDPGYLISRYK